MKRRALWGLALPTLAVALLALALLTGGAAGGNERAPKPATGPPQPARPATTSSSSMRSRVPRTG
jgi:hypothetical protein